MAYLDVIPLATAKEYLKVDAGYTGDDNQITRMIKSALRQIELATGHIADQRNKTYLVENGEVVIFDYPINSVVDPADAADYTLYKSYSHWCYEIHDPEKEEIIVNVGYVDSTDYPPDLVDAALELIDGMYYANSSDKTPRDFRGIQDISAISKDAINRNKRFIF